MSPQAPVPSTAVLDHERIQRALQQTETRLRSVVDSASMVLWALDRDGVFTFSQGKALDALGLRAGDVVGRSVFDVYADAPAVLDDQRRALAGEEFTSVTEVAGVVFECRYSTQRDEAGEVEGVIGLAVDITERRRVEAELRRREAQLEHTQRLAHLGSWTWEVPSNVVSWSDELYRIYGLEPSSSPATFDGYIALVHPDDRERVQAEITAALEAGSTFDFTERIVRPDGDVRVLRSQGEVVREAGGAPVRLVGACQDITDREHAEAALRNAEASYRAIFELSNDAIFVHDIETGAILDANQAACALHGCTLEELKALGVGGISDGTPPYSATEAHQLMERAAAGEPQLFEWRVRKVSDERLWVETNLRRIAINGVDRLLATVRDTTARKAAEAILQRSHEELEALVDERTFELARANRALDQRSAELEAIFRALPDLYFRLDADDRVREYRPGPDATLVQPADQLLGRHLRELLPADAWDQVEAGLRELGRTGTMARVEFSLPMDCGVREFEARLLPLLDSQVIAVARDITDRQRVERALRDSEEHYRTLIENSSDVATILGPDGVSRYQSPSIYSVLGYRPEEVIGTSSFDRVHPDDAPAARAVLGDAVKSPGETRSAEFRYLHRDGSWRVLEARARTRLPDSAGGGVIINSRDITDRKRYEEALERAKREAEVANRAKSDFLSRMSHELRTPLNSILGFAQLLERKSLPDDQRKGVEHIHKAGRHLLNLINEVLEIARIESGRHNLSLEPVRVATVLQESRALIQPLAAQRGLTIEECTVEPELFVQADRQRLVQVLLNLLSNAVKYNLVPGTVSISWEVAAHDEGRTTARIGVHDTGPGIEPEQLDRLFIPFERLGAERTDVEGTGLGLALSQRLVEAMGGTLTVESTPGEGSSFWVELDTVDSPVVHASGTPRREAPEPTGGAGASGILLYIEDNLPNLALIETILVERPGVRLLSALQGQMGLDLAWEHHPDMILLDLHLPDLHGEEVLRRLSGDRRTRRTPVVVVSADATPGTIERLQRAGASAYLTKPLDVGEFLATIDRFLGGRS
jgi:PAS domain S-box-containing protein